MTRLTAAACVGLLALVAAPTFDPVAAGGRAQPNVVVIMLDDHPEMGQRMFRRLPRIKSMFVDAGLRFSNHHGADPLCCPGRASFLTGLRSRHHGVLRNDGQSFDPSETIATTLRDVGYYTFIAGKYLNGVANFEDKSPPGWDHTSLLAGQYYDYQLYVDDVLEVHGATEADYSTDVIAEDAIEFLRAAPPEQPVFALLTPFATHGGTDSQGRKGMPVPAPRHRRDPRCATIKPWKPLAYNEVDVSDKPTFVQSLPYTHPGGWPLVKACESLLSVDEMVDRVAVELAAQGRLDDTLFVLTADNGMAWGRHRWLKKSIGYATPMPLRMHWPARLGIEPRTISEVVTNVDLAPTLAKLAGTQMGPYPQGHAGPDGWSLIPLMSGDAATLARDAILTEHLVPITKNGGGPAPTWSTVITTQASPLGLWSYTEWADGQKELYDMALDPAQMESRDGDPAYAEIEAALAARLASLIAE